MRKTLLASAAILGATGGLAFAQAPSQGQLAAPWAAGPAANNNNNSWGVARKGADAVPTPGTVVIRLNGRVQTDVTAVFSTGDRPGTTNQKLSPIKMGSYLRLYPGVDGVAANGLRYGAAAEIRENFVTPGAAGPAASPSTASSGQTLFVRRAFTYIASDKFGLLRLGQGDGVVGLFDDGSFSNQLWDGGFGVLQGGPIQFSGPGAATASYPWLGASSASEYTNNRIVYLTPQFAGFDFGVHYAPNMSNSYADAACASAVAGCAAASSGPDGTRWLNQVTVGGRYLGSFGGVDVGAFVAYGTAGKESGTNARAGLGAPVTGFKYDNLNFITGGAKVGFAGLTFSAEYIGGAMNGAMVMRPQGGAPENAVIGGVTYRNGPWTTGISVGLVESQGNASLSKITQRHETEFAVGGTYALAPGMALVAEYQYSQRHQGGVDFNAPTSTALATTRDGKTQGVTFGVAMSW